MSTVEKIAAEHAAVLSLPTKRTQEMLLFFASGSGSRYPAYTAFKAKWDAMACAVGGLEVRFEQLEGDLWLARRLEAWLEEQVIEICIASVAE